VHPLEQSLEGLKVGVEIDNREIGEDEDEGVATVTDLVEESIRLKYINIIFSFTIL
jgi:hypothetical protein